MGGKAFTTYTPYRAFPRMCPDLYKKLKDDIIALLLEHFEYAKVPIEGPEKSSHGDIDVLVYNLISGENISLEPTKLGKVLGARWCKHIRGSRTINLAFDWPEEEEVPAEAIARPATATAETQNGRPLAKDCSYQVDVHICPDLKFLNWTLFGHAHGDMWNVIGNIIRPFGLVRHSYGLFMVIAEFAEKSRGGGIDHGIGISKNLQRVLLTDDPSSTLGFLGLDPTRFWEPFESVMQMFDYAATCRFYTSLPENAAGGEGKKDEADTTGKLDQSTGRPSGHHDYQKFRKRANFHRWITEYVHAHPPPPYHPAVVFQLPEAVTTGCSITDGNASATVAAIRPASGRVVDTVQAAKAFFGPEFANRYERARRRSLLILGAERLWSDVRHILKDEKGAQGSVLGHAIKGLKRCVVPQGFNEWVKDVLARGLQEILDPTPPFSFDPAFTFGESLGEESDAIKQAVQDQLGFYVPGIPAVRRHFQMCQFDMVNKWIFGSNGNDHDDNRTLDDDSNSMWRLVSKLQLEKDIAASRLEMEPRDAEAQEEATAEAKAKAKA